jgi:hypothetical protein
MWISQKHPMSRAASLRVFLLYNLIGDLTIFGDVCAKTP